MRDEAVSVVIPVRNREGLIGRCLDSVFAQTWRPLEVIVVDNGSTDNTAGRIREWADSHVSEDFKLTLLHEPQSGAARARQRGFEAVTSDKLIFFDSDDEMLPLLIEQRMAEFSYHPDTDMVYGRSYYSREDGSESKAKYPKGKLFSDHIYHAVFCTPSYLVKRDFFEKAGGWNRNLRVWDDWELGLRILLANPKVIVTNHIQTRINCQTESITGTDFHSKAGEWERAIAACEHAVENSFKDMNGNGKDNGVDKRRLLLMLNYRRAILAAHYRREHHPELAASLLKQALASPLLSLLSRQWLRILYHYTALGGRGASRLWLNPDVTL